jgi:hypothetical protein
MFLFSSYYLTLCISSILTYIYKQIISCATGTSCISNGVVCRVFERSTSHHPKPA